MGCSASALCKKEDSDDTTSRPENLEAVADGILKLNEKRKKFLITEQKYAEQILELKQKAYDALDETDETQRLKILLEFDIGVLKRSIEGGYDMRCSTKSPTQSDEMLMALGLKQKMVTVTNASGQEVLVMIKPGPGALKLVRKSVTKGGKGGAALPGTGLEACANYGVSDEYVANEGSSVQELRLAPGQSSKVNVKSDCSLRVLKKAMAKESLTEPGPSTWLSWLSRGSKSSSNYTATDGIFEIVIKNRVMKAGGKFTIFDRHLNSSLGFEFTVNCNF